jgi:ankyrin repeat protein
LSRAAELGHIEVVKLLLEKGARPDFEDELGQTPLSRASFGGHQAIVELLNSYCTSEALCNNPIPKPRTNVSINDWLLGVRTKCRRCHVAWSRY